MVSLYYDLSFLAWENNILFTRVYSLTQSFVLGQLVQCNIENTQFLPALLKMAHLYQLRDLVADCEEYLQRTVTKENAVEAWEAAGVSGCQKLRDKALGAIARVNIHQNFF